MYRLIAAVDRELGIAKHGTIPWFIPEDEKFFTDQTKLYGGHNLIGRVTYETFKGPLRDRHNYVLTPDTSPIDGVELVHDLVTFLEQFNDKDLWVVGGAAVFEQVMELGYADELILTHVDATFKCDRFFPAYKGEYVLKEKSEVREQNGFRFYYATYVKQLAA